MLAQSNPRSPKAEVLMMGGGHWIAAGKVKQRFRPHVFKTLLNERLWGLLVLERVAGMLDAQLQRVSGHRSRESLADVQPKYQDAMSRFPVR